MSGYIGVVPLPQATQTRDVFTASAGQTSFATSGYTPGFLDVFLNGVKLVDGTDFTATNGSDVVLASGAATSDTVEVVSYSTYEVNNQAFTGDFSVDGTTFKVDSTNNLVGIGTSSPRTKLDIEGNFALDGDSGSTTSTAQTAIATYAVATFKGCKAVITANDGTDTYITELLIVNTTSAATATEYGQVGTGTFAVTYDVDVSGGNVRILATAPNSTSTSYKVSKTLM